MKNIYTSSGIIKNAEKPRTGIISQNSVCPDFLDYIIANGIDLNYEDFIKEIDSSDKTEEEKQEELDNYYSDGSIFLCGDWEEKNGKYSINKNGKMGFSLTYSNDSGNLCIEWSKETKKCNNTSPCYTMADGSGPCGDLDTPGDNVIAYALPEEFLYLGEK